jgi:uncharacterized phage-like protein YoqJ
MCGSERGLDGADRLTGWDGLYSILSGMAETTDTWFALSVLSLREKNPAIKLHCILPCTAQAEKWSASLWELLPWQFPKIGEVCIPLALQLS